MSLFFLLPIIPLIGGVLTLIYHFKKQNTNLLSNVFVFMSLCLAIILIKDIGHNKELSFLFFKNNQIAMIIKLQIDNLTIIMLLLINFISFVIHRYSNYYLASDSTQGRFMGQLSILTAAVSLLVMSGNLLTAFIAWQFIGLSLYLLLNHYHYNDNANKAAKKKFIINRLGDLCFLSAVILCYQYFGSSDFDCITPINNIIVSSLIPIHIATIIGYLVFIAVMTKSAQFPFHIWLPDTMDAPTPVSAIMHAGVINAGGFLLTRIHPILDISQYTSDFIFTIGVVSILTAAFFMLSQSDIKKQLAYSTMGQMGFMVVQCSLGLYTAAIFHLIAHGFFKAFLFLNAGSNLKYYSDNDKAIEKYSFKITTLVIFLIIFGVLGCYLSHIDKINEATIISATFISLTLASIFYEVIRLKQGLLQKSILIFATVLVAALYSVSSISFANLLSVSNTHIGYNKINLYKISLLVFIMFVQIFIWLKPKVLSGYFNRVNLFMYHLSRNKLFIEEFYRNAFLNPYRKFGDLIALYFTNKIGKLVFVAIIFYLAVITLFCISHHQLSISIILSCQIIFIICIAEANRTVNIRRLNINMLLAQIALANIGMFSKSAIDNSLLLFQIINSLFIFLSLQMLCSQNIIKFNNANLEKNRLTIVTMYFCILLFLWIGLPGTATFISEINIMYALSGTNLYLLFITGIGFVMLAIAILHALQEYVFASINKSSLLLDISPAKHVFIVFSILFNVINGLAPDWFLTKLN